ncbi:MAG: hypothetical protein EKK40_11050 [Bradyrhizobiaceae bacterium]|nr:MAG: hypothetical protein EKK40_11050 [Bradyrhizobiaceae bacterium]
MRIFWRLLAICAVAFSISSPGLAADAKPHRVVIQVDQNDPDTMNLALNNVTNMMEIYRSKNEPVQIEVVAYGPGLNMYRDDTSPVKDRLKQIAAMAFPAELKFSACNFTKTGMEKREGHPIGIVPQASLVPSGVVRISELQEDGWSYVKP